MTTTNINAQISIISTSKRPKLYTHDFEKKEIPEILKSSSTWNINKDMSNVSSIFNRKIKWDSLPLKTDNFALKIDFCQSFYKFEENENKETSLQTKHKEYSSENIDNNSNLNNTSINKNDNEVLESYALFRSNSTTESIPFSGTTNFQKTMYNERFTTQKNDEFPSFIKTEYETITPKFSPQKKEFNSVLPIARNPFPVAILGKSVISGLSSDITLLRTCFRVGEALKVFNLQQNSKILYFTEFFGIIKESINKKDLIIYTVGDLFHPLKGPYIYALYYDNHDTFKFKNGEILKVTKMYPSTWEEIHRIKETIK
ncbi:hypothetical protein PMAC_002262 [Pneumocystis sp. 'macacae']|nr:hypothetical protein PMAC_002262 [Pneumocystis sp. 'macacae']